MKANSENQLTFFWPIVMLYLTFQLVSDVTAGKIIQLWSAQVSVTVLYFPITYLISDVLTEVYGYARARRALWLVLLGSVTAGLIYQGVASLPPAVGFTRNDAYVAVLGSVPRILIFGWIAVFAGDILNNYVMAKLKVRTGGKALWLRVVLSTILGQFVNTSIFYVGALYGILPSGVLFNAIFWGWIIKVIVEVILIPLTYIVVKYLKTVEGIDVFDTNTNFNPISY